MVYNNLFLRIIFSIIILFIYFFCIQNIVFLFILGLLIYILIIYEIFRFFKKLFLINLFYISFSFLNFYLYIFNYFDLFLFNLLIFIIILFDTFSFFSGVLFGKKKLFQVISPNKTLEGYLGGIIMTNIIYIVYSVLSEQFYDKINYIFLVNLIILFASFGDLLESYFKRKNLIKNSSNLLPGHGGFYDRFDSFICAIILLSFFS